MDEIIKVDLFDQEIGYGNKMDIHRRHQLHRAFSLFIVDDSNRMLIQQRAVDKYHSGGLWSNACCSHPRKGETLEKAVMRRTEEELGIRIGNMQELFSFVYCADYGEIGEYEYDHVFLTQYNGKVCPVPEELQDVKWVALDELKEDLENHPENYSVWFQIAAPRVLKILWKGDV